MWLLVVVLSAVVVMLSVAVVGCVYCGCCGAVECVNGCG